jgi:hypothetical protein
MANLLENIFFEQDRSGKCPLPANAPPYTAADPDAGILR